MGWIELRLVGVPRGELDRWSTRLFALGAAGLQEDHLPGAAPSPRQPWDTGPLPPPSPTLLIRAWFEDVQPQPLVAALACPHEVSWHSVRDEDWSTSWQRGLGPVRITDSLTIAPPWDAPDGALVIEPGQGFGTGHHPSTVGALVLLEAHVAGCRTALDVGCGSGVLALAAARHGLDCLGIDVEASAVEDARRNAARNGLAARFSTEALHDVPGVWDLVLANLHAELLVRLVDPLVARTGRAIVQAGILRDRDAMVEQAYLAAGLHPAERLVDGEWVARVWVR